MISKREIHHSFVAAMFSLEEKLLCGWRLNPDDPPRQIGYNFEIVVVRDEDQPVKMTTQERLAKAREAKAAKRQSEGA